MKLQDLAPKKQSREIARVFESYFGNNLRLGQVKPAQAKALLTRVKGLLSEHRSSPDFHRSERNPAYLKLLMLERALSSHLRENTIMAVDTNDPKVKAKVKAAMDKAAKGVNLNPDEQKLVAAMASIKKEGKKTRISESEVQQAQTVLAAQEMIDSVQKMIEDATATQFKELPALVDSIRNDPKYGLDKAQQYNSDVTAALQQLTQSLQTTKQQLEQAQGVLTGAATTPDAGMASLGSPDDLGVMGGDADMMGGDAGTAMPPEGEEDIDLDIDVKKPSAKALGRERR